MGCGKSRLLDGREDFDDHWEDGVGDRFAAGQQEGYCTSVNGISSQDLTDWEG